MKLDRLFQDYGVPYSTEREQAGWLHIKCPYCGDQKNKLGCRIDTGAFNCWKGCDVRDKVRVFARVLHVTEAEAKRLIQQYGGRPASKRQESNIQVQEALERVEMPAGVLSGLNKLQSDYVRSRGFIPSYLEKTWELMSTGPVSWLDDIDYRFRILIPIFWKGRMVSFQCRDATGRSKLRYLTCPEKYEVKHHKHIVYMHSEATDSVVCTEGVFDVWRLGKNAVATFGIEFTRQQVKEMAKRFNQVLVLFDNSYLAQRQANKLVGELRFRGVDAENISNQLWNGDPLRASDPADMTQEDADDFMLQLGFSNV